MGTTYAAGAKSASAQAFVDRVLSVVAVVGAVGGAVGGTVLGAEAGTAFPVACGTLGTMLGSGLAASTWCAFVWPGTDRRRDPSVRRGHDGAPQSRSVRPAPDLG